MTTVIINNYQGGMVELQARLLERELTFKIDLIFMHKL